MGFNRHNPRASSDPNGSQNDGDRLGGSGDRFHRGEFATVVNYQSDRYTATLRTERGRVLRGIPRLRSTSGEVEALASGTEVLISYDYGTPIIMGIVNTPANSNTNSEAFSVSDVNGFGGEGFNQSTIPVNGNFRAASEPRDLIPGDWAHVGTSGNLIGVLGGGSNVMKSGALSQIRTHLINDLVEIFSRNYRHVTDMGEFTIFNNDGRINMRFRGGTDQRSETGADEEHWTVRLDLGSEGDLFNFELTTTEGQPLFRIHVDSEGAVEIFGINGVALTSGTRTGGSSTEEHAGNQTRRVGGDRTTTISGSETHTTESGRVTEVRADDELSVGNDYRLQTLRDIGIGAGRNAVVSVQGGEGPNALLFDIEDGNWKIDLGSATSQDSGFELHTVRGPISFESTAGGDFSVTTQAGNILTDSRTVKLKTSLPDSVVLGGDSIRSHVVMWEELQQHLLNLYQALDLHVHTHNGTATAGGILPVAGVSGPPTVPIGAPLVSSIRNFCSQVAGVSR